MKKITDPKFRYTPSFNTDLRKSFRKYAQEAKAKAEREQAEQKAQAEATAEKVTHFQRSKTK